MKINIWSDIRCPFCYVGKKRLEEAMARFPHAEKTEVIWHSFQLDPELKTQPERDPFEFFSESKGIPESQARLMHQHASNAGKDAGIDFNFEQQKIANSFRGHLLIQLAKEKKLASEMEEALFRAQFIEAKNIDEEETLIELGKNVGLSEEEVRKALKSDDLAYKVKQDMDTARNLGINSVPFFVFNDKYAISGAQKPEVFLETLEKSWKEFAAQNSGFQIIEGDSCDAGGHCN